MAVPVTDTCVVAATGPSLCRAVAEQVGSLPVVAVNDAWRLFPDAMLYAADFRWWKHHAEELRAFKGRKLTCRADVNGPADLEDLKAWGVEVLNIDHGQCSGYGAIRAALHLGFKRLVLVGFDMRLVHGRRHYFGDHVGLRNTDPQQFVPDFAALLAADAEILNATPNSALRCFPMVNLEDAIE